MTALSTLLGFRNTIESPLLPLTSTTLVDWLGGPKVHAGVSVTEKSALGVPAVWRAVNLVAGTAAMLPLHAYKREGEKRTQLSSGQAADLLADPHPDMTPFELWQLCYGSLLLWGNAYFLKLYNQAGQLSELWWLAPDRVKTGRASTGEKFYVVDGKEDDPKTDRQILHIPGFGYDGICGVSPIRAARQGIGLTMAAEEYGARFFGGGSLATGILQTEQRITVDQADELKVLWKAGGSGLDSAHDIRVMGSGAKWQQLTIPNEDAQFLETRQFQLSEIGRMFGVPPILLFDTERSTSWGTGIEQQMLGWVMFGGLRNWLTPVEQRVTKMIRPAATYARYSLEGLLRGDSEARAKFYRALWEMGVLSTNEIREMEDRDPVADGDARYRPLNFGLLGTGDTPTTEKVSDEPASDAAAAVPA